MASDFRTLPRGMRLNNPGNLRANNLPDERTHLEDGFNRFDTLDKGVEALCRLTMSYYDHHNLKTLDAFIGRYAPASENDVTAYVRAVCNITKWNPLVVKVVDMRLDRSWNALALMRAIVAVENGRPPITAPCWPEWISPGMWVWCMSNTRAWPDLGFNPKPLTP